MAEASRSDWYTTSNPDVLAQTWFNLTYPAASTDVERERCGERYHRRCRLFGCACARTVWDLLPTDARSAVTISERLADARATEADLRAATIRLGFGSVTSGQHALAAAGWASSAVYTREMGSGSGRAMWQPMNAARSAAKALAARAAGPAPPGGNPVSKRWQNTWNTTFAEARTHQTELIRDIFPPPGYVPALRSDWRTSTVVAIARQMDETGDYSAVPILADALQDAGCYDEVMLARCRAESGVHCRGNWVVDLVLGRE